MKKVSQIIRYFQALKVHDTLKLQQIARDLHNLKILDQLKRNIKYANIKEVYATA